MHRSIIIILNNAWPITIGFSVLFFIAAILSTISENLKRRKIRLLIQKRIDKSLKFLFQQYYFKSETASFLKTYNYLELTRLLTIGSFARYKEIHSEIFSPLELKKELTEIFDRKSDISIENGLEKKYFTGTKQLILFILAEVGEASTKLGYPFQVRISIDKNRLKFAMKGCEEISSFVYTSDIFKLMRFCSFPSYSSNKDGWFCFLVDAKPVADKPLIKKVGEEYIPLFTSKGVSRDNFFHLRRELIHLGCPESAVLTTAQQLHMQVLRTKDHNSYKSYIMSHTYKNIKQNIKRGYHHFPIQNPQHPHYSHIDLFSSIYGFEIDYLRKKYKRGAVADIGSGDGIFLKLINDFLGIRGVGFEVDLKPVRHTVNIKQIKDFTDITESFSYIVLNHVLEHVDEEPLHFLKRLIRHFNSLSKEKVETVIFSLPIHDSVQHHLAAKHIWICHEEPINGTEMERINHFNFRTYYVSDNMYKGLLDLGYELMSVHSLGIYIVERFSERKNLSPTNQLPGLKYREKLNNTNSIPVHGFLKSEY